MDMNGKVEDYGIATPHIHDARVVVVEGETVYRYRCEHCGHEWLEEKASRSEVEPPGGYRGD